MQDRLAEMTLKLGDSYAHLCEDGRVLPVAVDEAFWQSGIMELPSGRLVSCFDFAQDWGNWEMHPAGDELVLQLTGSQTFILALEGGEERKTLCAGQFLIVPRGIWHTADVVEAGRAMFITQGEGTEHRERG